VFVKPVSNNIPFWLSERLTSTPLSPLLWHPQARHGLMAPMELIDAQIHEVKPPVPVDEKYGDEVRLLVGVEICREAMDAAALTFDYAASDIEEQVATYRDRPGMLAGRGSSITWG
jgi:hypothetical protein